MVKRTGPTNKSLKELIVNLKKLSGEQNIKIWKMVAEDLEKPTRQRRKVNIYRINKCTRDNEIAIIPGKVLSEGELKRKITIASFQFSDKAKEKINKTGKAITIQQLMKENPRGKNTRIIG